MNDDYTEVRLRRTGDIDLVFRGVLLAEQSTYEDGLARWAELRIWRTDSGKYVMQRLGRTTVEGEVDKNTTRIVVDPNRLAEALRSKQAGVEFMSNVALDALDEAAANDPLIDRASVERI